MKRRATVIYALLAVLLAACAPPVPPAQPTEPAATAGALEPVHLKLGILNYMSHSPFFIAQEEGYFAEQGLDVELVNFASLPSELSVALHQGQLDVGGSSLGIGMLNAIAQGSPVRAVADKAYLNPDADCATDVWVARTALVEDGTLDDLSGLRGLNVSVNPPSVSELVLDRMLEEGGLTLEDVEQIKIQDMVSRVEAFRGGALDVALLTEPWLTRALREDVVRPLRTLESELPRFSSGLVYFSESMYALEPEVGVRFLTAYLKAVRQYNEGKTDRNVEILTRFTQLEPDEVREMCWPSFRSDGMVDLPSMLEYEQWALETGNIDALVPVEQIWDPQFIEAAAARLAP